MTNDASDNDLLLAEIDELRREVNRLTEIRDRLVSPVALGSSRSGHSVGVKVATVRESCVFDDDDDGARAFDEFYRAYDEVHVKTRKFLLG